MIPQSNAQLLSVTRGGYTEDYDRPAVADVPPVWSGTQDAYVQEKIRTVPNPTGGISRFLEVTLLVSGDLPVRLEPGDVLSYQRNADTQPTTGKIADFTTPADLAMVDSYYKCVMEEINTP